MQPSSRDIYAAAALIVTLPLMDTLLARGMPEAQAMAVIAKKAADMSTAVVKAMGE